MRGEEGLETDCPVLIPNRVNYRSRPIAVIQPGNSPDRATTKLENTKEQAGAVRVECNVLQAYSLDQATIRLLQETLVLHFLFRATTRGIRPAPRRAIVAGSGIGPSSC